MTDCTQYYKDYIEHYYDYLTLPLLPDTRFKLANIDD